MIALFDDGQDDSDLFSLANGALMNKAEIKRFLNAVYGAVARLLFGDEGVLNDVQHVEASQMTLRNLVTGSEFLKAALIVWSLEIYQEKQWLIAGLDSWGDYLDHALPEDSDRQWRHLLRKAPVVLAPVLAKPVQARLPDGSTKQIDVAYLANRPSMIQDLIPIVGKLNPEKPEDREKFDEIVAQVATKKREEARTWLAGEGLRGSQTPPIRGTIQEVQVVDHDTQEVGSEWVFNFRACTLAQKIAIMRKLAGLVDFPEE